MDQKTFKRFRGVNTAVNIAACGTCVAIFGLNPIALGLSYIGTDIIFSIMDAAIERGYIYQWKKIDNPDERKERVKQLREIMSDGSPIECEKINMLMQKMYQLQERLEIEKEELQKKQQEADEAFEQIKNPNYDMVMNTIDVFLSYYHGFTGSKKKSLKEIKSEFARLKENVEKQPNVTSLFNRYFYIYTQEMINLLEAEENVKEEKKAEYQKMLDKTKKEYLTYLLNLNTRIEDSFSQDMEISVNVLLTELERINGSSDPETESEEKKSV